MWKKEWQALVKNKMLLIAMAALILIPTIYSGLFLGSMWDPYGNVDHLPVAVVNLDQSTDYQGKTLEVGKNLVDNLKENQALDFHFVSEKEAEEGLADGTYYMTMTIPEDFSKNASTVLDKKPQKMELMYETNPGTNYIASKMSETGLAKIKEAVAQEVTRTYTETMFEQIADAGSGMGEAADGAGALAALDANADMVLGGSTQAVSGLYDGIESVRSALNSQLIPGAEALQGGIGQVQQGVDTDLKQGVAAYTAGVSDLKNGLDRIDSNSAALQSGVSQLSEGTEQLTANNGTLLSGAGQIASGAGQISDGAAKLAEGSQTLGSGIFDVRKGSQTLKKGLEDGAKQVSSLSATEDTFDMFSAPVEASGTQKTYVENNGHAMAPYMMSVALWVGCIAFCILYPLNKYEGELKSGLSWYGAKASVMYVIAIVMALVMIGLLHVCDGFSPVEMGKTTAFAVLASIAFMSVIYFFEMCFGKIGSFMMLIFMVVQLAGSAGTYPVEISAGFVAKIHRWLPFTYTVDAFRSTISGGESIRIPVIVLTAVAIVFIGLTILVFEKRAKNIRENKKGFSDYLESKGLA